MVRGGGGAARVVTRRLQSYTSGMIPSEQIQALVPDLAKLTDDQFAWVKQLAQSMALPYNAARNPSSDVLPDDRSVGLFFLYLVTRHTVSAEPFKKEKFEYALEKILAASGRAVSRPSSRPSPGLDLTVDGAGWSLKTEAAKGIKKDRLHVSKWMELGKGDWGDTNEALRALAQLFLGHLARYERIFTLRCLTPDDPVEHRYELLELPKSALVTAATGEFQMMQNSKQRPKPGYCRVADARGLMFELYFDGGTERKLRLQKLRRDLCTVHAEWQFQTPEPKAELSAGE